MSIFEYGAFGFSSLFNAWLFQTGSGGAYFAPALIPAAVLGAGVMVYARRYVKRAPVRSVVVGPEPTGGDAGSRI
jgi:hypothetical protein